MFPRIKICCISSLEEAELAIALGADALGLVADMPSGPGVIDDDVARDIAEIVPPPIATFLLTQRSRAQDIADHVRHCGTSTVQIVRHIDPREHEDLKRLLPEGVRRVQVIHVEGMDALDLIPLYAPHVHAFLLDSGRPSMTVAELGGTGRVHDWRISAEFVKRSPKPVFLAGGLNPGNIVEAVRRVNPFGVDLCNGVRDEGGLSKQKLESFMTNLRTAAPVQPFWSGRYFS